MARVAVIAVIVVILGIASGGLRDTTAQDTTPEATLVPPATATPTAYPLRFLRLTVQAQAEVSVTTDGPVVVSVATAVLPPISETIEFRTEGLTVFSVQSGAVTVRANAMIVRVTDIGAAIGLEVAAVNPEAGGTAALSVGSQISVSAGTTVSLRNDAELPAVVVILTAMPDASPVSWVP